MDIAWIRLLLLRELTGFSKELELFQDEGLIWMTRPGVTNSAGTLALHVSGNLQHYIGAVLGGSGYTRDRDHEFSARDIPRSLLLSELRTSGEVVDAVLSTLPAAALLTPYPDVPNGLEMQTGLFLLHLATHLAHHLGQAGYLRRVVTGENRSSGALSMRALALPTRNAGLGPQ